MTTGARRSSAFVTACALCAFACRTAESVPPAAAAIEAEEARVILLVFPGLDGDDVERLMDAGELPHLASLRQRGSFAKVTPVVPSDDIVAWLSLNTGRNPAETGVPGYVGRRIMGEGVYPELADLDMGTTAVGDLRDRLPEGLAPDQLPEAFPVWTNRSRARNFWDAAADQGVPSLVLRMGMTFGQPAPPGARVLAGEGYPDARFSLGDWFVYTTDPAELDFPPVGRSAGLTAGTVFRVEAREGRITTRLYGPSDFWRQPRLEEVIEALSEQLDDESLEVNEAVRLVDELRDLKDQLHGVRREGTSLPLEVELLPDAARVTIAGVTQELAEGEWSEYYRLRFEVGPELVMHALTRIKLVRLDDPFRLYVDSIDVDPAHPPFWQPLSQPPTFASELAAACGSFDTYGWGASATMGYKDGELDEETLLEDIEHTMRNGERLTHAALARDDWRLLVSAFTAPDRAQHALYGFQDVGHPLHDADEAAREVTWFGTRMALSETVPEVYRQADRIVGELLEDHVSALDTLLVVSPFGFESHRRQVELNAWLEEHGYLTLDGSEATSRRRSHVLQFVDWKHTRAYALGMGGIYLNLAGREPEGIVPPAEAKAVREEIRAKLLASVDEERGEHFVAEVQFAADVHGGPYLDRLPDLLVGFAPGYRIAWATTPGGLNVRRDEEGRYVPGPVCSPNDANWSGVHDTVATDRIPGMFLSNRRFDLPPGGVPCLRIAPTVLSLLDLEVPAEMDMPPLSLAD